jgi:hypothetical protein
MLGLRCRAGQAGASSTGRVRLSEGEYTVVGYLFDEHGVHMYDHRQVEKNLLVSQLPRSPGRV